MLHVDIPIGLCNGKYLMAINIKILRSIKIDKNIPLLYSKYPIKVMLCVLRTDVIIYFTEFQEILKGGILIISRYNFNFCKQFILIFAKSGLFD